MKWNRIDYTHDHDDDNWVVFNPKQEYTFTSADEIASTFMDWTKPVLLVKTDTLVVGLSHLGRFLTIWWKKW